MLDTKRYPAAAIFLGVLALAITPGSIGATTWLQPQRPLSATQWLEYDVSGADAVGIGRVIAVKDTIVDINAKDGSGFRVRSFTLQVSKWLKRENTKKSILEVGVSPMDEEPVRTANQTLAGLQWSEHSVLFMLRSAGGGWGLCDGPDPEGAGLRAIAPSELAAVESRVRRIVTQQTVDSMLAGANLVFLGHSVASGRCGTSADLRCARVAVDTVLAGSAPAETVSVFTSLLGDFSDGPALYVLRATLDGYYEALGHRAGIQRIRNGQVQLWRLPVEGIRARIQRVRSGGVR